MGREEGVGREERAREKGEEGRVECRKRGESKGERRERGMLEVHWKYTAVQLTVTPLLISHLQAHNDIDKV